MCVREKEREREREKDLGVNNRVRMSKRGVGRAMCNGPCKVNIMVS